MKRVIVGVSAFNHDAAAALIIDGVLCGFLEEERMNEQKSTGAFPLRSINELLNDHNLSVDDITDIAFYFSPKLLFKSYLKRNNPIALALAPAKLASGRPIYEFAWLMDFIIKARRIPAILGAKRARICFYPHHDCHIWYGIFAANRRHGVVLSNDSIGEATSSIAAVWAVSRSGEVSTRRLFSQASPHSIGYLYGAVTERLGFNRQNGAGKVMALASFCEKRDARFFEDRLKLLPDGQFRFRSGLVVDRSYKPAAPRLHRDLLARYPIADSLDDSHYDLAYGVQKATELILDHQIQHCAPLAKMVVVTGGVAQNSVANGILTAKYSDNDILVPPIPHDSGCAIGAALLCAHDYYKRLPRHADTAFLGSEYGDNEITAYLSARSLGFKTFSTEGECLAEVAAALMSGKAVGLFRGPMECGPRALGNRSIIALPSIKGISADLNSRVKYREVFRPYGVIVCESKLHHYFEVPEHCVRVPHMTHVFPLREAHRDLLSGVQHVDRTCRVQTASPNDRFLNGLFDRLQSNGLPRMTINTSMNVMGKPISRSIGQALACFYTSGLDVIVFNEKFLIAK